MGIDREMALAVFDKLDRLGMKGVELLLGGGRKDDSGDFTKGAGLNSAQSAKLISFILAANDEKLRSTSMDSRSRILIFGRWTRASFRRPP